MRGRMVRAANSSLSLACHTGTTLCASTWCTSTAPPTAAVTRSCHPRTSRSGHMSVTSRPAPASRSMGARVASGSAPLSMKNGTPSAPSVFSTARSPLSMKRRWRG